MGCALDSNHRIDEDLFCCQCEYNLRGLSPEGACPECGTPVLRSTWLLRFAEPAWVRKLYSGLNWIGLSILLSLPVMIFVCLLDTASIFSPASIPDSVSGLLLFLPTAATFIGCWKFSSPDPGQVESALSTRSIFRYAAAASAILAVLALLAVPSHADTGHLTRFTPGSKSKPPTMEDLVQVVAPSAITAACGVISILCGIVAAFAALVHARLLALRIPDKRLARSTSIVMWGIVVTVLLMLLLPVMVVMTLIASTPAQRSATALATIFAPGCGAIMAVLVFGGWAMRLLTQYRRRLGEAARLASRSAVLLRTELPVARPVQ